MAKSWLCPYCNKHCSIGKEDIRKFISTIYVSKDNGFMTSLTQIIVCPNESCREKTINLSLAYSDQNGNLESTFGNWSIAPESSARPFPDYIPIAIRNDYEEACLIKTKSPKASATLSRRCIQGMIRDFWGIKKGRLIDEINALETEIDPTSWKAIDSVRGLGNIGAHMEKNVNVIIDVDPEEAETLIQLIETLIDEWYIHRYERDLKMQKMIQLGKDKKTEKSKKNDKKVK